MNKLTARQEQILNLIKTAIENTGFPPTRAEIAAEMGFRSANAAEEHLQALARKGAIEIVPGTSRGIRVRNREEHRQGHPPTAQKMTLSHLQHAQHAQPTQSSMPLPLVGRVAAGSPILAQEHVEATYNVDPSLFKAKPDYLLKVRGMSMRDAGIFEGDLIAVKKIDQAKNGQIIVARIGNDVTVKRFKKSGSTIELLPENPDYKSILIEPHHNNFVLEGLVVGLLRTCS